MESLLLRPVAYESALQENEVLLISAMIGRLQGTERRLGQDIVRSSLVPAIEYFLRSSYAVHWYIFSCPVRPVRCISDINGVVCGRTGT